MLAAIDRGYAENWVALADGVAADPSLRPVYEAARDAAESTATVALLDDMLRRRAMNADERALERLRDAFAGMRMSQAEAAAAVGTSRTRLNSYLTGAVTPSMSVLVAMEEIARRRREPGDARRLVLVS